MAAELVLKLFEIATELKLMLTIIFEIAEEFAKILLAFYVVR